MPAVYEETTKKDIELRLERMVQRWRMFLIQQNTF